jgi:nucleotide-binding universal stress UspA family protein
MKILVALDQSEDAQRVVRYVAEVLGGKRETEITLFHAIRSMVPIHEEFDMGELPESTREAMGKVFDDARRVLMAAGLTEANIKTEFKSGAADVAQEILTEAEAGGYDTIAMGRRGMGRVKQFFIGSISNKVVQHARGRTVWLVE